MKDDRIYLAHIRDAIERIESFTAEGREQFLKDRMIQDAVIRNLEVIGEAVKGVSESLRAENPDIPWQQIAGMRDVLIHHYFGLIHHYFGVKIETVWQVVDEHIPVLHARVDQLLS